MKEELNKILELRGSLIDLFNNTFEDRNPLLLELYEELNEVIDRKVETIHQFMSFEELSSFYKTHGINIERKDK